MIKPFGKHRTSVRARRNNDVSSNSGTVSRAAVRYRTRKKKRLFTVVTVVVASVMVPIMIASAANTDMSMQAGPEVQAAQTAQAEPAAETTPAPKPTAELTEKTLAAPTSSEDSSAVTAKGESPEQGDAVQEPVEEQTPVYTTLMEGMTDPSVPAIQQRLMDLYYMGADETTDYFGPQTSQAIRYFQRKHGLAVDGAAGPETQALLFSDQAKQYTMALGADGADVQNLQERLKELGYPISEATGYFGDETDYAVRYFQRMSGLTEDGSVGHETQELLFSKDAEPSLEYAEQKEAAEKAEKEAAEKAEADKNKENEAPKKEDKEDTSSKKEESASKPSAPADNTESKPSEEKPKEEAPSYTADPGSVEAFISVAEAQLGKPYRLGGKGPNSFDCSGLIYYALRESGNDVPYRTSAGWRSTDYPTITNASDMQRGDIICMNGHVAIYLGDGMVLDASSSKNAMVKREFGSWFQNGFIFAKRPL